MTIDREGLYGRITRRIAPTIFIAYVLAYLDRVNVGFAKLRMLDELGFSETVYGLGAGIFFVGYFLFEVPSNLILHRVGARIWIARIMVTWGLLSSATMFATTPATFYLLRFLLGAAEAGFFPGVILYLTYWYPAERRGRITATFMSAIALSSVVGSLLSGWVLGVFEGVAGLSGWKWLFLIEGIPSVLFGVWIFLRMENRPQTAAWLSPEEKAAVAEDLAAENADKAHATLADAFRNGRVWLTCLIYFSFIMGLYGVSFWLPTLISDLGVKSPLQVGLLAAIPYGVAALGMILTGKSADARRERRWHVAGPALIGAAGLVASVLAGANPILALAALSVATYGILTCLPLFWSLPTAFLGGTAAAAGIALINSFGNLAGFVSPYAVGWLKDATHSTNSGMYLLAAFMALGAALVLGGMPAKVVNR